MPRCSKCDQSVFGGDMVGSLCADCDAEEKHQKEAADQAVRQVAAAIVLSTEAFVSDPKLERIGIVAGTCVYGQHIGKDILSAWRDIVGGRAKAVEKIYNEAREQALHELRLQAAIQGASLVSAIQVSYNEITSGSGGMVFASAVGTAFRYRETL